MCCWTFRDIQGTVQGKSLAIRIPDAKLKAWKRHTFGLEECAMTPVISLNTAAQPLRAVDRTAESPAVRRPGEEDPARPAEPRRDEYIPEEKREPSGRYWPGRDGDGQPRIYFDDPQRAADAPEEPAAGPEQDGGAKAPEKKDRENKAERCTGDTGKVDREIEKLKRKRAELEQRLNTERDEAKREKLEQQLAQVEAELRQKDNDGYRRRNTVFSFS